MCSIESRPICSSVSSSSSTSTSSSLFSHAGKDVVITVVATPGPENESSREISYIERGAVGSGSFGIVYQARLCENNQIVAIKRVLQDKRFKNRELQIMRKLDHCNIVKLLYFFYNTGEKVMNLSIN